jgi:GAF domain-containing protein
MPDVDLTLTIAKQVDGMQKAGGYPSEESLSQLAGQIAQAFRGRKDEVAILRLLPDGKMLRFLFPIRLQKIGAIPITSSHSLAAKTIREKRGEIVNNFSVYKHPTVFEAVDLSAEEKAAPIQKIVSSPMIVDGKVVGVIQVSRKGKAGDPIGSDFTPSDLTELNAVGTILGKFVATLPTAPPGPAKPSQPAKH